MKIKETDLAKKVVDWLNSQYWEVYQEVKIGGSIADIVATQGNLIWIIECKLSMSLELIGQAFEWKREAHFVSVAVPKQKQRYPTKARRIGKVILRHYGIGLLEIRNINADINDHLISPKLNRKAYVNWVKNSLCEKQKYWAPAGSCNGGYWTPYKETCRGIVRIVNKNPGIFLKDLIDSLDHHYANDKSAKASIRHWIGIGAIKGVRYEKDGRFLRFYPKVKTLK